MIRSFWKTHCEGWFGSSELAADGSAEAEGANTQSSLAASEERHCRQSPLPPNARKRYSQSSPIFIALTPLSMEDDAAIAASFQKLQASREGQR